MAEPIRLWKKEITPVTPIPEIKPPLPTLPEAEPIRLWKKPPEVLPVPEKVPEIPKIEEVKPLPLWKKATAAFTAGVGDVFSTTGSVLDLVGAKRLGEKSKALGESLRKRYIPPQEPKEFSWKSPLNPEWWATTVTRAAPFGLSLIPAAIVGAYGGVKAAALAGLGTFGRTVLGSLGGVALSRPIESALEAGGAYEEAIARGKTKEEAEKVADKVFRDNMILAGADVFQFITAFAPIKGIGPAFKGALARRMLSVGKVGARIGAVGAIEAGEEGYQDAIVRRAIGEKVVLLDPRMSEAMAIGAVFGAGLGTAGSVYTGLIRKIKKEMPPETIEDLEKMKAEGIKKGLPEQRAEVEALDRIAKTPEGRASIERTIEDLKTKVKEIEPVEVPPKIAPEPKPPEVVKPIPKRIPPEEVKPRIKPIREIEIPPRPITRKVEIVELLKKQKKEIISVLRQKQEDIGGVKQQIVDYVKASIPLLRRGMYLGAVKRAETQRDLIETFTRIDKEAARIENKTLAKELRDTLKAISKSGAIAIDYKQKIRNLVESVEVKGHIPITIRRLRATEQFIKRQKALGKDVFMPERVLESLKILERKPITEMSAPEIQLLIGKIKDLEKLGRTKLRTIRDLYEIEKERLLEEIVKDKFIKPIEKQPIFRPPVGVDITFWQSFHNKFNNKLNGMQHVDLSLTPMDVWFDILDGSPGTYEGVMYKIFKKTMDSDWGNYLNLKDNFIDPLWKIHDKYKLTQAQREKLGVYAIAIQEGGMERLLKTGYSEQEIKNIVLTPQEMEIYNYWARWAEEVRPQIADLAREMYNIRLGEVENYFPFMTDFKMMSEVEIWRRFGEGVEEIGMPTKNVEIGFLKERVAPGKVKIDFMEVATRHMDNVAYFLTMAKDIKMLHEIANSSKFGEKVGDLGQEITLEWIDLMARKGGQGRDNQWQLLDTLRKNIGVAVLGFRLSSALIQPTAFLDGASLIGIQWVGRGAFDFISDTRWRDLIRKLPEIKKRGGDDPAFLALSDNKTIRRWQEYGFAPLKYLDLMTAGSVATGAYQKYLHKHKIPVDFEKLNPEAAEYAQKWMRRTQSSAFFKDAPLAISRGRLTGNRSFDRAVLQFMSFLLTRWSVIRHDAWRAGIKVGKTMKGLHILFWVLMMGAIAEFGIKRASNTLLDFVTGRPKRDDGFTKKTIFTILGNVPLVSNALSVSVYGGELMPVLDALEKPLKAMPKLVSEREATKIRGLIGLAESVLTFMGIPGTSQFGQLGRGWVKGMEEREKIKWPPIPKIPKPPGF